MIDSSRFVFVVGIPRSGTTWVHSILGEHPECTLLLPEMLNIDRGVETRETGLFVANNFSDTAILNKLNIALSLDMESRFFVEKTPLHLLEIERIRSLLPDAHIICTKRNVLDIIWSMLQVNMFWVGSPKNLSEAVALVNMYSSHSVDFKYTVRYELLWDYPYSVIEDLLHCLNLSYSGEMIKNIYTKTQYGKNLRGVLKQVFREGVPGQGLKRFTVVEKQYISNYLLGRKRHGQITY